jgi:hypothetical protein
MKILIDQKITNLLQGQQWWHFGAVFTKASTELSTENVDRIARLQRPDNLNKFMIGFYGKWEYLLRPLLSRSRLGTGSAATVAARIRAFSGV